MEGIVVSFIVLASLICFFGTKIANWLSDEDRTEIVLTAQPSSVDYRQAYIRRNQARLHEMESFRYASSGSHKPHLSIVRRYGSPAKQRAA